MTSESRLLAGRIFTLTPNITRISCPVGRPGGNRTPNLRFWRPPLCQLSYWPKFIFVSVIAINGCIPDLRVMRTGPKCLFIRKQACAGMTCIAFQAPFTGICYSIILLTTPAPTVRPPSRIANRNPSSIAIGDIKSTTMRMLSPGITISEPSGSSTAPVTSVVLK